MKRILKLFLLALWTPCVFSPSLAQQMPQDYWVYEGLKATGQFWSLAVGPDGLIYTGSNNGTSISVFDKNFALVRQFGSFSGVRGIVINSQTNVFVVVNGQNKVKVFDAQGGAIREFGGTGTGDGQFIFAETGRCGTMAAVDTQDRIYVTDGNNHRVQVFDSQGVFLRKWGSTVGLPESLSFPKSIIVLPNGHVWVWGAINEYNEPAKIQVFDANGTYLKSTTSGWAYNMALTPDGLVAVYRGFYHLTIDLRGPDLGLAFVRSEGYSSDEGLGSLAPDGLPERVPGINGYYRGFAFDKSGDFYFTLIGDRSPAGIYVMRRKFKVDNPLVRNRIPQPSVIRSVQRPGTALIDIDYRVVDADSPRVQVAMLGFVDGGNSLGSLVKMSTFAESTQANLGASIPANTNRRVTWNVGTDYPVGFVNLQFEILAKDERGLLPFHFITVPTGGANAAFTMSHQPVGDDDLLSLWYWLIAGSDPAITLLSGQVKGAGGSFDGQVLASGTSTTAAGRSFLYQRLNVRSPTSAEITRAQSGRYGFGTISANSVVKLP